MLLYPLLLPELIEKLPFLASNLIIIKYSLFNLPSLEILNNQG
jgi:hypothetical protein